MKKLTVIGTIGNTHGVSRASSPEAAARSRKLQIPRLSDVSRSYVSDRSLSIAYCGVLNFVLMGPDPKAEEWANKNEWFGQDEPMTLTSFSIHRKLVEEGFLPAGL